MLRSAYTTAALAGALAVGGCDALGAGPKPRDPAAARPVVVESVSYRAERSETAYVAVIRPRVEADLAFRVGGRVDRRLVDVGQSVRAGQPIAVLDQVDLRLQLEQAEAEVKAASSALDTAVAAEQRKIDLNARGWAPAATFEQQRAAADEARSRLARASRAVTLARNAVSYATLTADADGIVTAAMVEPGQVVAAGQSALRVAHTGDLEALVALPEAQVLSARASDARLTLWAVPGRGYDARLRELAPAADPATRTFAARFAVSGAGPEMQIGMTGTLVISDTSETRTARLPLAALFNAGDGPAVWVVDAEQGTIVRRAVTVAGHDATSVRVSGGLAEGERVVALGVHKLDPGQKVRVVSLPQG